MYPGMPQPLTPDFQVTIKPATLDAKNSFDIEMHGFSKVWVAFLIISFES